MTSTTSSYLKRAGQVGAEGLRTMESGASIPSCFALALVYAPAPLFFSLPPVLRKSKCVRSSFIPPSLYPARFLRVLSFFLSPLVFSVSPFHFGSFPFLVRSSFSSSYLLRLLHLFYTRARRTQLTQLKCRKLFYMH